MKKVLSFPKGIGTYLSEVKTELVKVTWPKRDEVVKLTTIVLLVCFIAGIYVGALDFGLTKLLEAIVSR